MCRLATTSTCWVHKYNRQLGKQWLMNTLTCSVLLPILIGVIMVPVYLVELHYEITLAVPFRLVGFITLMITFINIPLVILGSLYGKYRSKDRLPGNNTRLVQKQIPTRRWFKSTFIYYIIAGFLPFTAVSVELYYIL